MAKEPKDKKSKVLEVLKKEYPFESLLLGLLGSLVLVLGIYIFEGRHLTIRWTDLWIFATALRVNIFAIIVMLIGVAALFVALSPFFFPGLKEMRRVSWPKKQTMYEHTARVFGFVILLGLMFMIYDLVLRPIFEILYDMGV